MPMRFALARAAVERSCGGRNEMAVVDMTKVLMCI